MKKIINILSFILHPIFLPLYGFITIVLTSQAQDYLSELLTISICCIILPIFIILIGKIKKTIDTISLQSRKERKLGILILIFFTAIALYKIKNTQINNLYFFLLSIQITLVLLLIINIINKVSIHAAGWSGIVTFLFYVNLCNNNIILYVAIILCGLVCSSRLYLKSHTQIQVYLGCLVGMVANKIANLILY